MADVLADLLARLTGGAVRLNPAEAERLFTFLKIGLCVAGFLLLVMSYMVTSLLIACITFVYTAAFNISLFLVGVLFQGTTLVIQIALQFLLALVLTCLQLLVYCVAFSLMAAGIAFVVSALSWICPAFPFFGQVKMNAAVTGAGGEPLHGLDFSFDSNPDR